MGEAEGTEEGVPDGCVVGEAEGAKEGAADGEWIGGNAEQMSHWSVTSSVVGEAEGTEEGVPDGSVVGEAEGTEEGVPDGVSIGSRIGKGRQMSQLEFGGATGGCCGGGETTLPIRVCRCSNRNTRFIVLCLRVPVANARTSFTLYNTLSVLISRVVQQCVKHTHQRYSIL